MNEETRTFLTRKHERVYFEGSNVKFRLNHVYRFKLWNQTEKKTLEYLMIFA